MTGINGKVKCARNGQTVYEQACISGYMATTPFGYPGAHSWVTYTGGTRPPIGKCLFSALTTYSGQFQANFILPPGRPGLHAPVPDRLLTDSNRNLSGIGEQAGLGYQLPLIVHVLLYPNYGYNVSPQHQRFLWIMNVDLNAAPGFERTAWLWGRSSSGEFWFKLAVT